MNNKIKYLASAMMVAACGASFSACDDWTDTESIDLKYNTVEDAANYADYLEALRAYRATDHTLVYAWVSLTPDGPKNQSERLTSLPDSIDVLVVSAQGDIHSTVLADMKKVREDKAMKIVYQIDFDAIKADHTALCENLSKERSDLELEYASLIEAAETDDAKAALEEELEGKLEALADPELIDYVLENLESELNFARNTGFEGVIFAFDGKASNHLTDDELAEYTAQQLVFLGAARDWHKRYPQLSYDFLGKPQNVTDKNILAEFNMVFLRQGLDATNVNLYTYYLNLASVEGVPAERLGMMSTYISADSDDETTGVFSDGSYALDGFAQWVAGANVACIGIHNVQNDYFNPTLTYPHVRAVIQAANPSIK